MKVVINKCYGGFGLSDRAIEECIRRGMTVTKWVQKGNTVTGRPNTTHEDETAHFVDNESMRDIGADNADSFIRTCGRYSTVSEGNPLRCHPTVVTVVEELGSKETSGRCAELRVVEIPFDGPDGWEVHEYDGMEHVAPVHETWG